MTFTLQDSYSFQGLSIAIENQQGDIRAGTDPHGQDWEIEMKWDYGYIRGGALGNDGEALDVYIGPDRKAEYAYIVKQHAIEKVSKWPGDSCPNCESVPARCACPEYYDEDKVMLGFSSEQAARDAYLAQYDNPLFLGPIVAMPIEEFKSLVRAVVGVLDVPSQVLDSAQSRLSLAEYFSFIEGRSRSALMKIEKRKDKSPVFRLGRLSPTVVKKLAKLNPGFSGKRDLFVTGSQLAHIYLRHRQDVRKLVNLLKGSRSKPIDGRVYTNTDPRHPHTSGVLMLESGMRVSKDKTHAAFPLNVSVKKGALVWNGFLVPADYGNGENREHETEVLLDSEGAQAFPLQSLKHKRGNAADLVHNSESNNPNLVLILDGVNTEWSEVTLEENTETILDRSSNGIKLVSKRGFSGAVLILSTMASVKRLFLSNLSVADIKDAKSNEALATVLDEQSSLASISTALRYLKENNPNQLLSAQIDDDKNALIEAAIERMKEGSEGDIFQDSRGAMQTLGLKRLDQDGAYLKGLAAENITTIMGDINDRGDFDKLQKLPEYIAYEAAKKKVNDAAYGDGADDISLEEWAEMRRVKELAFDALREAKNEPRKKLAAAGEELIKGVVALSPITDKQAKKWAGSITIEPAALKVIKRDRGLKKFKQDVADFYQLCHGAIPYLTVDYFPPEKRGKKVRASANVPAYRYNLGTGVERGTTFHELTHILENNPRIKAGANSFLRRRAAESGETEPEKLSVLNNNKNYKDTEIAFKDNFVNAYQGKVYKDGFTEIFTMLTQELSTPARAATLQHKDPEAFEFMMGLLAGVTEEEREFSVDEHSKLDQSKNYREQLLSHWKSMIAGGQVVVEETNYEFSHSFDVSPGVEIELLLDKTGGLSSIRKHQDANDIHIATLENTEITTLVAMEELLMGSGTFDKARIEKRASSFYEPTHVHGGFNASTPLKSSIQSENN